VLSNSIPGLASFTGGNALPVAGRSHSPARFRRRLLGFRPGIFRRLSVPGCPLLFLDGGGSTEVFGDVERFLYGED
jgi:hypothetical protein